MMNSVFSSLLHLNHLNNHTSLPPDGSLYMCFKNVLIPTALSLSLPCSFHLFSSSSLGEGCRLSFVSGNLIKISFSTLFPGDVVNIFGFV